MSETNKFESDARERRLTLYIVKADGTSYVNYIKPLILIEELQILHTIEIVETKSDWYQKVHPERYVPALKDHCDMNGREIFVFESTACLQYLAERYDTTREWTGQTSWERAQVLSWTAYFTAGLGATAKYWLYFAMGYPNRQSPERLPKTIAKLRENCLAQWNRLNQRLAVPGQLYIALPDRPTIADISYFPFTLEWMFSALGVDIADWPHIKAWNERLLLRPAFQCIMKRGPNYGHSYLIWTNPVRSVDGKRDLPTCPYRWPNGQGDVGKFLEGERNSSKWQAEHGRIYRIWSGLKSEMQVPSYKYDQIANGACSVLTHPEDVEIVFNDSDKHLKAKNGDSGWLMGELLGSCMGLVSGVQWRKLHSVLAPNFSRKASLTYIPLILKAVEEHITALRKKGSSQSRLHPVKDLRLLPFWILAEIIYGELSETQKQHLKELITLRESIFMRMIQGGVTRYWWSKYMPQRINGDLKLFQREWKRFNITAHKVKSSTHESCLISTLFQSVSNGEVSCKQLLQTLDEMLFANLEVTIGGLSWSLYFLAKHEDVQSSVRHEILAVQEKSSDGLLMRNYISRASTLVAFCILESARLRPVAPFSVPQSAPTDRNVSGYLIPAGVNFIIDTNVLNVHSSIWGHESTHFRPTRFSEDARSPKRYGYWRFGFGPRQCLGKYIADLIIRATLVGLLGRYRLHLPIEAQCDGHAETWTSQPSTDLILETHTDLRSNVPTI